MKYRLLDLFSGIGGFSLGLERSGGFETVAFCEIDGFCRKVLRKHWPDVPQYEDVRALTAERLAADGISVDAICGGFPCQDISTAGKGAGLEGERSGLWFEYARIIGELEPQYVIVENVAALLSRGIDRVLGDLAALGYDAEWHCLPASAIGAPHRRDRIWIVANAGGRRCGKPRERQVQLAGRTQAVGAGQAMAHADNQRELQSQGREQNERRRVGNSRSHVAYADQDVHSSGLVAGANKSSSTRCQSCHAVEGKASHGQRVRSKFSAGGQDVADPERGRLQGGDVERAWSSTIVAAVYCRHCGGSEFGAPWRIEPDVGRVAYGVPHAMDRLKGLGNAVVPQIPELIGRAIMAARAGA